MAGCRLSADGGTLKASLSNKSSQISIVLIWVSGSLEKMWVSLTALAAMSQHLNTPTVLENEDIKR